MADSGPLREIRAQLKTRMDKAVEDFRKAMAGVRTGRASVHMLDGVSVDYYGSQMPLNQVAQVHAPEPQLITVQPFDASQLGAIEKAIRAGDMGLNPMNDGKLIRVPVPPLTQERRQDMETPAPRSRRTSHGRAQHPPRRQRRYQEGAERQENLRGRREARA